MALSERAPQSLDKSDTTRILQVEFELDLGTAPRSRIELQSLLFMALRLRSQAPHAACFTPAMKAAELQDGSALWAFRTPQLKRNNDGIREKFNCIVWEHAGVLLQVRGDEVVFFMRDVDDADRRQALMNELETNGCRWDWWRVWAVRRDLWQRFAVDCKFFQYAVRSKSKKAPNARKYILAELHRIAHKYEGPIVRQAPGADFEPTPAGTENTPFSSSANARRLLPAPVGHASSTVAATNGALGSAWPAASSATCASCSATSSTSATADDPAPRSACVSPELATPASSFSLEDKATGACDLDAAPTSPVTAEVELAGSIAARLSILDAPQHPAPQPAGVTAPVAASGNDIVVPSTPASSGAASATSAARRVCFKYTRALPSIGGSDSDSDSDSDDSVPDQRPPAILNTPDMRKITGSLSNYRRHDRSREAGQQRIDANFKRAAAEAEACCINETRAKNETSERQWNQNVRAMQAPLAAFVPPALLPPTPLSLDSPRHDYGRRDQSNVQPSSPQPDSSRGGPFESPCAPPS
eukprot:TRINITY_DN4830_c0_g1_i1.p1 TRINITY_DN4830_c0_g1~~TRINITY_DN4830_c0_g1_i1.p1  ORF type:complete len:531 (-),score=72.00 TRINITY_DN4830_c0_g1_i1:487-2079(-)